MEEQRLFECDESYECNSDCEKCKHCGLCEKQDSMKEENIE